MNTIVESLVKSGATRVLYVGGTALALYKGEKTRDFDVEVYGLNVDQIVATLEMAGLSPNTVGRSFGVIKVRVNGNDFDISVPRTENRIGAHHKDFAVSLDQNLTPWEASRRRDLTINALAVDAVTGQVLNLHGGLSDLHRGIIRATCPETFVEDPLRVLRIAQILPRKGKRVDSLTLSLCRLLVSEFPHLPKERIFEELRKLLMLAKKPAKGLRFLQRVGWLRWFPELDALRTVPQNRAWHPEGSVWNHTLLVVNRAAEVRDRVPEEWREPFMWAALLHDVGKAVTTRTDLTSPGHDEAGGPLARTFMERLGASRRLVGQVEDLTRLHMRPDQLFRSGAGEGAWRRLHRLAPLEVLGWLSWSDSTSRPKLRYSDHSPSKICFQMAEKFSTEPVYPLLMGRDLLAHGIDPGPKIGKALRAAFEQQLEGCLDKNELLRVALNSIK